MDFQQVCGFTVKVVNIYGYKGHHRCVDSPAREKQPTTNTAIFHVFSMYSVCTVVYFRYQASYLILLIHDLFPRIAPSDTHSMCGYFSPVKTLLDTMVVEMPHDERLLSLRTPA